MASVKNFSLNVFINCPFDDGYTSLFEAILFTVFDCGFIPRHALEENNSVSVRINKIEGIIRECKYGIHDISRAGLDSTTKLPRFNMPFELGLFLGCRTYGGKIHNGKSCIILDAEKFRYRDFISDIGGQDIKCHSDNPKNAIKIVRDFLSQKANRRAIPSSTTIISRFDRFLCDLPASAAKAGWDSNDLTFMEKQYLIKGWLKVNAP